MSISGFGLRRWRRCLLALLVTVSLWSCAYAVYFVASRMYAGYHSTPAVDASPPPATSSRQDQFHFRIPDNHSHLVGVVWPRQDEQFDRVISQIEWIDRYANATSQRKRQMKTILRVGDFNWYTWNPGQTMFADCPVSECALTRDRRLSRTAAALLITEIGHEARSYYLPKPKNQVWITQHWESPLHDRIISAAVRGLINWTVSYRRDSTIPINYMKYYQNVGASMSASNLTAKNYAAGKTKKVAWFVSNCNAWNYRRRYARELSKFIQIDMYGGCGSLSCPRSDEQSCLDLLRRDYKFYLAFENSNCDDYITEKLSHVALSHDVIPIVMGARREDYASFAPTHSYIHVDDFTGPQQLADYLHLLDRNDTLYNEYFTWKGSWMNIDLRYWCRLCALLHWRDDVDYISWYDDYRVWWNGACERNVSLPWFQQNNDGSASYLLLLLLALFIILTFVCSLAQLADPNKLSVIRYRLEYESVKL